MLKSLTFQRLDKTMGRQCDLLPDKSRQVGNRVSHAKNRTKHVFKANIQSKRVWDEKLGHYVKMNLSTQAIRLIDKKGGLAQARDSIKHKETEA
jgi:large subunit ribosomal protein L28